MRRRLVKIDGKWVRQVEQSASEVQEVIDSNHYLANTGQRGGTGSKDVRFVGRVPAALYGQWAHDWRLRGGLKGTGMKCRDYVLLKLSLPDYKRLVATPSGKVGLEREARRLLFGFAAQKDMRASLVPEKKRAGNGQPLIRSAR